MLQEVANIADQCIEKLLDGNPNELLAYIPDEVCEACILDMAIRNQGSQKEPQLTFDAVLDYNGSGGIHFDSISTRVLAKSTPSEIKVQSQPIMTSR